MSGRDAWLVSSPSIGKTQCASMSVRDDVGTRPMGRLSIYDVSGYTTFPHIPEFLDNKIGPDSKPWQRGDNNGPGRPAVGQPGIPGRCRQVRLPSGVVRRGWLLAPPGCVAAVHRRCGGRSMLVGSRPVHRRSTGRAGCRSERAASALPSRRGDRAQPTWWPYRLSDTLISTSVSCSGGSYPWARSRFKARSPNSTATR